ncbi:MAG: hypothetical protein H6572_02765 [Lewinellaceae bacterium]|nr:hypothetical protein [Lewinellaceae bacterium]
MIQVFKYLALVLAVFCFSFIQAQSFDTEFGKNRVQYNDDFKYWSRYETASFITYWYGKSKMVARTVMPLAEMDHSEIQSIIEHRINDKIEILVYSDLSDLKQSNIGSEQSFTSITGQTKIVGNKMFVYFDGDHQHLRQMIREGIATVYINAMIFGSDIQEIVQNAVLLNLPPWYKSGLVSYVGSNWDFLVDDELREILDRHDGYDDFEKLSADYPRLAGHSMWYYISQQYGKSAISNILYLTKISRSLDNALDYTLNANYKQLQKEWRSFYQKKYEAENGKFESKSGKLILLKNKDYVPVSTLSYNPIGTLLAYAYNEIGKIRVDVLNPKTKESKTIFKYGYKNSIQETDYNYPKLCWSNDGKTLSLLYDKRDRIYLRKYDVDTWKYIEQVLPEDFHRVYSMDYIDEKHYLFAANTDGFSDLYNYDAQYRNFERITTDFYDDLDAIIGEKNGHQGIYFRSNRTHDHIFPEEFDTILSIGDFDLFFYDLESSNGSLQRLTKTKSVNEKLPIQIGEKIYFISNESGINNEYVYDLNTEEISSVTNLDRNIIIHHGAKNSSKLSYMMYNDGAYQIFSLNVDGLEPVRVSMTDFRLSLLVQNKFDNVLKELKESKSDTIPSGMKFQSKWEDPQVLEVISEEDKGASNNIFSIGASNEVNEDFEFPKYKHSQTIAAGLKFRLDNFVIKADNEVLFEGLESFTGDREELSQRPLGVLLKSTIKDLFEDYVIEGGMRLPTTFDGSEYFLTFERKKTLIDKKYILYRKSQTLQSQDILNPLASTKKQVLLGMYQLKYPLDVYTSIRATGMLRFDKFFYSSVDNNSFFQPFVNEKRVGIKIEYVFDNTLDFSNNILHGTRYKVYSEIMNQFNFEFSDGINVNFNQGLTYSIGMDFRHYIPILKKSVLALRATGAMSFGNKPILYILGGVNNWLLPKYDYSIAVADKDFSFKNYAPNLRGFDYNIRNGTRFVLGNVEFRVPLFQYLLRANTGAAFFRNFQFVMFCDLGTAWYGSGPFDSENPINSATVEAPPAVTIHVQYYRDPLVVGYGAGVRTTVLGYFLKLDYGKGIDTRLTGNGKWYLTMGLDF